MAILFTIKVSKSKKRLRYAKPVKVEKNRKTYSRKQKHKLKEN